MSRQQVDALSQTIADLEQKLSVAHQQLSAVRQHLHCSRYSADFPLQPHGPSKVCQHCFDQLRTDHAKVAIVFGSITALIKERMSHGHPCPFCNQPKRHSESCYLTADAGAQILDEYRAIEQHRDMLLAERSRWAAPGSPAPGPASLRLKGRFHANGQSG